MCAPQQDARPSGGAGPDPASPSWFIHSKPGAAAPSRFRAGGEGRFRTEGPCRATTPTRRSGPAAIPARPRPPPGGGLNDRGGPRPRPEPHNPTLHEGAGQAFRALQGSPGSLGSQPPGCPTAAGSLPAPPPQRQTSPAAEARPSPRCLRPPRAGWRKRATAPSGPPSGKEQRREPEAGLCGYLDNPAGQPGHLVRSQVRPPV